MTLRRKCYQILKVSDRKGTLSYASDVLLIIVILLNALALILETVESIQRPFRAFFRYFDLFSILQFYCLVFVAFILAIGTTAYAPPAGRRWPKKQE